MVREERSNKAIAPYDLCREQERTARGEAAVKAGLQTSRLIHLLFEVS
jgi:hypothetical protein